jgi:hypothetical protein
LLESAKISQNRHTLLDELSLSISMIPRKFGCFVRVLLTLCVEKSDVVEHVAPLDFPTDAKLPFAVTELSDDYEDDNDVKVINPLVCHHGLSSGPIPPKENEDFQLGHTDDVSLNPSSADIIDLLDLEQEMAPVKKGNKTLSATR